jgi:hypothetical protein
MPEEFTKDTSGRNSERAASVKNENARDARQKNAKQLEFVMVRKRRRRRMTRMRIGRKRGRR